MQIIKTLYQPRRQINILGVDDGVWIKLNTEEHVNDLHCDITKQWVVKEMRKQDWKTSRKRTNFGDHEKYLWKSNDFAVVNALIVFMYPELSHRRIRPLINDFIATGDSSGLAKMLALLLCMY